MVVVCEKCGTRFHLGDARVPEKGARVRCSRCKHSFFIAPPGAGKDDVDDEVVAEVTGAGAEPLPELAGDLAEGNPEAVGQALESAEAPARGSASGPVQAPAQERRAGELEEDWEFNDESPPEIGMEAQPELAEHGQFEAAPLDLGESASEPEPEIERPDPIGEPEAAPPLAPKPALDPVEAIRARDAGLDFASPDDLGSPEEWDFVGAAEIEHPPASAPEPVAPPVEETAPAAPAPSSVESPVVAPAAPVESEPVPLAARFGSLASIAGWLLVGLAFAMGMSGVLTQPGVVDAASREPSQVDVSGVALTASGVTGRLVENALAGDLLVVSGELENPAAHPITPGRAIQVQLISASGEPVAGATAAAGLSLSSRKLRERDPGLLRRELELSAKALAHRPIGTGERLRFDAVFESVPEAAAGWVLEAATFQPDPDPGGSLPSPALPAWE